MSRDGLYAARGQGWPKRRMSRDGLYAARGQGWPKRRMSRDGVAENCSCIFCTSAIRGGRMPREAMALELFLTVPAFPPSMEVMGRSGACPVRRSGFSPTMDAATGDVGLKSDLHSCIPGTSAIPGGRQITAPCVICTSAILGGCLRREVRDGRPLVLLMGK